MDFTVFDISHFPLQGVYQEAFMGSCLENESRIGACNGLTYAPLAQTSCGSLVNLFLLPDLRSQPQSKQ